MKTKNMMHVQKELLKGNMRILEKYNLCIECFEVKAMKPGDCYCKQCLKEWETWIKKNTRK